MRFVLLCSLAVLITGSAARPVDGQRRQERARADSLVAIALESAQSGDTTGALVLLDSARKADERFAPAHYHRGLLLSRTSDMGFGDLLKRQLAVNALSRAIELDGENPWALLELGRLRLKMPFMRIAAEQLFERALKVARQMSDPGALGAIHFEIGQIYDRRFRAVHNRHAFIGDVTTFDTYEAQYDRTYVENFLAMSARPIDDAGELDHVKAESSYRAALAAEPGNEGALAALAILLYEKQRFEEMADIARTGSVAAPGAARVHFALGLALLRMGEREPASATLEQAYQLLTERERGQIASIAPILKQADARAFEAMPADERAARERAYWDLADPLLLTTVNEARLAFLGRVAYADLMFSTPDLGIRGALTDRGTIVLRYGEPPIAATFAPDVAMTDMGESLAKVTTVWLYPESKLRFVFIGPPAFSTAWFAADFRDYTVQRRAEQPVRFDNLPGGLTVDSVPFQIARFRGTRPLTSRVEVYADFPTHTLATDAGLDRVPVETALLILDGSRRRVVDDRDTVVVRTGAGRPRPMGYEREFQPGEYGFRLEALEAQANRGARALGVLSIFSFPTERFSMSDILLGRNVRSLTPVPRSRDDIAIEVLADLTLDPGEPVGLYWESYGATPSSEGMYRLQVDVALTVVELSRANTFQARFFGGMADALRLSAEGKDEVAVRYSVSAPVLPSGDDRLSHQLSIDISSAPPAEYRLDITMTDLESGRVDKSTRTLYIRRP